MALNLNVSAKLSQTGTLSLQQQRAIKILQLGRQECISAIADELLENPFLEEANSSDKLSEEYYGAETEDEKNATSDDSAFNDAINILNTPNANSEFSDFTNDRNLSNSEFDWNDYFSSQNELKQFEKVKKSNSFETSDFNPIDNLATSADSLEEHLFLQLHQTGIERNGLYIAREIIGNLDDNGYLVCPTEEIAEICNAETEQVENILRKIQTLDPIGIASRNLQECLSIQLEMRGLKNTLPYNIVQHHLSALELKKLDGIARAEKCNLERVYEAIKVIKTLNPRPGDTFNVPIIDYIVPDIYIRKINGEWKTLVNDDGMPKLQVNSYYQDLLNELKKKRNEQSPEKDFFKEKAYAANWLIKTLQQRQSTIQRVTESILKLQPEFLECGIEGLKPLCLKDIADDLDMHESTISRATTNKFAHTPYGVFELKFFFSTGFKNNATSTSTDEISAEAVKNKIKIIVENENSKKPLCDQAIVKILKADGVNVARRTVSKYRDMLGILSSSRRKELF